MRAAYRLTASEIQLCEQQAVEQKLPPLDLYALDAVFSKRPDPDLAYDWNYSDLNDYRHRTYLMEKAKNDRKRKSTENLASVDSAGSLASQPPEDLRIATPDLDESPQIKRRASKPRQTVAAVAESMGASLASIKSAYENLQAAFTEVRVIAKEAEKTNEMLYDKVMKMEATLTSMQKQSEKRDVTIEQSKLDISLLKKQFEFRSHRNNSQPAPAPATSSSPTRPAGATANGTAATPAAKSTPAVVSPPPAPSSSKKPSVSVREIQNLDDEWCSRCGEDYPAKSKHVCSQ